jgi:hypothetical protein
MLIFCFDVVQQVLRENNGNEHYKSVIVTSEDEMIKLANKRYDCQILGENKWLMKRKLANGLDSDATNS